MSETAKKVECAVKMLRMYCGEDFWSKSFLPGMSPNLIPMLCFSGGKDSILTKFLCDKAGIKYNAVYSITTIDPPPVVQFIKNRHPEVDLKRQPKNFFEMILEKGFPIRQKRWCCEYFKENTGNSFLKIIGVRHSESAARAKRWSQITKHREHDQFLLCPSLYFEDFEVWEVIKGEGLSYCELYDCGFHRLGCIGCPMATTKERRMQLDMFPRYESLFMLSFSRLWGKRAGTVNKRSGKEWFGSRKFKCSDDLFEWWISGISSPEDLQKVGFEIDDLEDDGNCDSLFDFAESCDLGMF